MDNTMDRYLGQMLDNRYELLEVIGNGGMAVVYKALCHVLNRYVAVKILKDEYAGDTDFREHFKAESRAVAMLSHPNIVAVYDYSKSPDCQYIVMELLEGITLKQYMQKKGALSWKEALHFATQTAKALSHAHGKGIVHRDIKPQNIMVGKDGSIKVADFGIAHLQNESYPDSGETVGSIHYISPEQAKGEPTDARSDLYSLGIVMYEMLTGQLPYEGDSVEAIAVQHFGSPLAFPGDINPDIPERLEQITLKAMNSDIALRYQSADELLDDLEEFRKMQLTGEATDEEAVTAVSYESDDPQKHWLRPVGRSGELSKSDYARRRVRSRKVSTFLGYALVIIFILATVSFLYQYWIKDLLVPPERIEITHFVGSQVEDVINSDMYKDLYRFTVTYTQNADYAEGVIISQDPEGGRSIAPSNGKISVTLTVSTGSMLIEVPDVAKKDSRTAKLEIEKLGFKTEIEVVASDDITEGWVVRTNPEAGQKMPAGSVIYIYVSGGPIVTDFDMPNLLGKTRDNAIITITENYLTLGSVSENYSNTYPEGTVSWQNINAGTKVKKGTMVYITISLGPEPEPSEEPSPSPPASSAPIETPPPTTPVDPSAPVT